MLLQIACDEFWFSIDASNLLHIDIVGATFTWARRRVQGNVASRLDRAFCLHIYLDLGCFSLHCSLSFSFRSQSLAFKSL